MTEQQSLGPGSIVTAEAVLLDFQIAGLASRSLAYALDLTIQFFAVLALTLITPFLAGGGSAGLIVLLVGIVGVLIGYPVAMETLNGGRTVGRIAVGTRVVTIEGAPVRFRHALIRALLALVELLATFGSIAILFAVFSRRGQRLGDLTAGTMVIRERASQLHAAPVWFQTPFGMQQVVAALDTSSLPGHEYQLLRDFLRRRDDIHEPARTELAGELARIIRQYVPSAHELSAEQYLSAVSAATQKGQRPPPPSWTSTRASYPPPAGVGGSMSPVAEFLQPPAPPPPAPPPGAPPAPIPPPPAPPPPPPGAQAAPVPAPPAPPPPSSSADDADEGFAAPA